MPTKSARVERWRSYFETLLNVPATVDPTQLDQVADLVPCLQLDRSPDFEETVVAVNKLKNGRAPGPYGVDYKYEGLA